MKKGSTLFFMARARQSGGIMANHVHLGVQHVLATFASVVVVGFFWRVIATKYHNTAWGRAMAFAY